jgi:hypothetical protein
VSPASVLGSDVVVAVLLSVTKKEKGKYIRVQPENSSSSVALPSEVSVPCALLKICR